MASSADVHVRICGQEIIKYDLEIKALVQDIRDCPGPQSTLMEFNSQVKEKFNKLRLRIQDLEQMAREQDRETDRLAILSETENQRRQMLSNQTAWRKANLACKLCIDHTTSSRTVLETNEEFKSMTGTIHFGRKLILKYNRRELTDKLLIFLALALFFATVLYILKKRLFPFI
ncbi:hypothetical protein KUCAC02_003051 [Chaenocephalus aceratus]|uniref:Uncharacterized protein n=1 Tax=Chaenocephalus aceratus TaxID=36190 RepID=A0ACB9WJM3_CHAAC|nr:hypothetical protein KUCAC02_003051 [Chaenocephalus aceratus]